MSDTDITAERARIVYDELRRSRPKTVEAVASLKRFAIWTRDNLEEALADLVAIGAIWETASGHLVIGPWPAEAAA